MPELSAPLRLTWDLPADPHTAAAHWGSLVRARVLYVELGLTLENLTGLAAFADELCDPGTPQVTLSAGAAAARAGLVMLPAPCLRRVDLLVLPPHRYELLEGLTGAYRSITLAVWSTADGLREFPSALRVAGAAGGGEVAVLNPPAPAVPLTPEQRRAAAAVWARQSPPAVQLRVHDLFLARELGMEPFREYAGCQAGHGLAHLDAAGAVSACRTLPVVLGNLGEQDLPEIWAGPARRTLRDCLAEAPAGCVGCVVADRCRGGCRGLLATGAVEIDLGARDPSCPGPWSAAVGEGAPP